MNVLVFVVLLGFLVFVHELGHFVLAKRAGVKVEEFGFGFPPRLLGFRRGETEYTINAIPLGGFVRMLGEDDPAEPRSFARARRRWRVAILVAGATMNLLFAVVFFSGAYMSGWPTVVQSQVKIYRVMAGSPAATAGLQQGDVIVSVEGKPVTNANSLHDLTMSRLGDPTTIGVTRNGRLQNVSLTPRKTWPSNEGPVGIGIQNVPIKIAPVHYAVPSAIVHGFEQMAQTIGLTVALPVFVLRGLIPLDLARPVGPVGIFQLTSQATAETASTGWLFPLLFLAGTLSAGLGVANLLPIPGLDGGRLLFVLIETIRGRRVNPQREGFIHLIGMAVLLSLVLIVTYFDVLFPVTTDFVPH